MKRKGYMCAVRDWLSGLFLHIWTCHLRAVFLLYCVLIAASLDWRLGAGLWVRMQGLLKLTVSLHLGICPLHVHTMCMCLLYLGSGSALPFQDQNHLLQISLPHFFVTFLVLAPPKPLYVSVHYSFNVCHAINCLMTFPIVSITNILEGKA